MINIDLGTIREKPLKCFAEQWVKRLTLTTTKITPADNECDHQFIALIGVTKLACSGQKHRRKTKAVHHPFNAGSRFEDSNR
jgi:hypothetical protein